MNWNFDNSYVRDLEGFYAPWKPAEIPEPALLLWNAPLAEELDLSDSGLASEELSGNRLPRGAEPIALAYAGHQFGSFSPQLGDGRAILLGEHMTSTGRRFDVQLKGSGRTPFSRSGDGKYALAPALREHLVSESMAALGIASTRSLAVTLTGEQVQRQTSQPGAILTRIASSHIRVGTFQFFAAHLGAAHVKRLADYAIRRHYPASLQASNPYLAFFEAVMDAQIRLVADWVNVGFVHGVMNTDNVAISGETIDFGPCAFLDAYSANAVFSSIDEMGRYAFGNQPNICRWNLVQLGSSLAETITETDSDGVEHLNELLRSFAERYQQVWLDGVRRKLGFTIPQERDLEIANSLFELLEGQGIDFTNFFRGLAKVPSDGAQVVTSLFSDPTAPTAWLEDWLDRIAREPLDTGARRIAMDSVNPLYIPRNHRVEEALEAAIGGDMKLYETLLEVVTHPYGEREGWEHYAEPAPASFGKYVTFCGT